MLTKAQNKQPKGQTGACQQCFECESCPSFQLLRSVPLFYPFPISFQQYPALEHQLFSHLFVAPLLGQHSASGLAACQPAISHLVQFCSPALRLNLLLHSQTLLLLSMPRLLLHLDQFPIVLPLQFMLRFHPLSRQLVFIALQLSELVGMAALTLTLLLLPLCPFLLLRQQTGKLHKAALPVWCFLDSMVHQSPTKSTEI